MLYGDDDEFFVLKFYDGLRNTSIEQDSSFESSVTKMLEGDRIALIRDVHEFKGRHWIFMEHSDPF